MEKNKRKGISGAALKWMAIICMLIDHIGATVALQMYYQAVAGGSAQAINNAYLFYYVLRCIGRFSFPVYCFLLVEGFYHTRSRGRYLRNLAIFALLSELPFDLAFHNSIFNTDYQNVFLTLAIGLAAIWLADLLGELVGRKAAGLLKRTPEALSLLKTAVGLVAVLPAVFLADALNTDYGGWGIAVIYVFYLLHDLKTLAAVTGVALMTIMQFIEIFGFPSIFAIRAYNGSRGKQMKYFFYAFYPVHLLILYGVCKLLGYY